MNTGCGQATPSLRGRVKGRAALPFVVCRPARTCHLPEPHCWLAAVAVAGLELVSATVVGEVRGVPLRRALAREEARAPCASRVLANAAADVLASTGQHCAPMSEPDVRQRLWISASEPDFNCQHRQGERVGTLQKQVSSIVR